MGKISSKTDSWDAAWARICEALGVRTQVEVAAALGIRQSSVSDAKRRGAIPADWQIKLLESHGLHPVWVRTGAGPKLVSAHVVFWTIRKSDLAQVDALFQEFIARARLVLTEAKD